jgi:hypothetical protein
MRFLSFVLPQKRESYDRKTLREDTHKYTRNYLIIKEIAYSNENYQHTEDNNKISRNVLDCSY